MRELTPEELDREVQATLRFGSVQVAERLPESVRTLGGKRQAGLQRLPLDLLPEKQESLVATLREQGCHTAADLAAGGEEVVWLNYDYDVQPLWLPYGPIYGGLVTLDLFFHRGRGGLGYVVRGPTPRKYRPCYLP